MKRRHAQSLSFEGWSGDGDEILVYARMTVKVEGRGWVKTGPLLLLTIQGAACLEEDIVNVFYTAHARDERRRKFQAVIDAELDQDPLF